MRDAADLAVVGAGVVGLTTALAWQRRHPGHRVVVLDKEDRAGLHASGRNSGVLHAGFYYSADSLKARFSAEGCRRMADWCEARGLPLRRCGKLVVARTPDEVGQLEMLAARGEANGVTVELVDAEAARRIEPRVRTTELALWSPSTGSVDPAAVMRALAAQARDEGIEVAVGRAAVGRADEGVRTEDGVLRAARVLNCAGLYADRVASWWGVGERYRILPFKGLYAIGESGAGPLACHVYPVPEPGMPFLGVHFTVTPEGTVMIGPTALPALWREQYRGCSRLRPTELAEVLTRQTALVLGDPGFRGLAVREAPKLSRRILVRRAAALLEGVRARDYPRWGRPGIRAQLLDTTTGGLVRDFVVEEAPGALHVLNAVSPAFTCSLPLADHLVERLEDVTPLPEAA